jgi:LysM repeat protein
MKRTQVGRVALGCLVVLVGCGVGCRTPRRPAAKVGAGKEGPVAIQKPAPVQPAPVEPVQSVAPPRRAPVSQPARGDEIRYTVKKGDSLSKIAWRYQVRVAELQETNQISNPAKLRVGQQISLPAHARERAGGHAEKSGLDAGTPEKAAEGAGTKGGQEYVVKSGDSLSKIASAHGTTVAALRAANHLKGDRILKGQKLVIPAKP